MRRGRPPYPDILTPREQEVMALLREGLTNQQIADRLGISRSGVAYHVSEILSKLGVATREEAAAWQPEAPAPRLRLPAAFAFPLHRLAGIPAYKLAGGAAIGAAGFAFGLLLFGVVVLGGGEDQEPAGPLGKLAYVHDGDIWALELPDGDPARLTDDGRNHAPRWSPSGAWLLFEKPVERGSPETWVMRADGSDARRIDVDRRRAHAWAPAEDTLAYLTTEPAVLWVENADGSGRTELLTAEDKGFEHITGAVVWSPDGRWIALTAEARGDTAFPADYVGLWAVRADGAEARELVVERDAGFGLRVAGWTPDGRQVIYSPLPSFSASFVSGGLQWFTVALDQIDGPMQAGVQSDGDIDNQRRVLPHEDYVDISQDGTMLAVRGGGRDFYLNKSIALVDADQGVSFTDLTDQGEVAATSPAWSPDGSTVAYVEQPLGQGIDPEGVADRRIWLMDADGSKKRRLTQSPLWEERPQWSSDGRNVLYVLPSTPVFTEEEPRLAVLVLRNIETGEETVVMERLQYHVNDVERGIFYFGHLDWSETFDWWRP